MTSESTTPAATTPQPTNAAEFPHYFKDVRHLEYVDVYRVLVLYSITDPSIAHALKKLLVAGGRTAGKSADKDIAEAIASLQRWQEMRREDARQPVPARGRTLPAVQTDFLDQSQPGMAGTPGY